LYTVSEEQRFKIKAIHSFASRYMRSWFPGQSKAGSCFLQDVRL